MTAARCHECAAPLAAEQRWCVVCGARQAGADPRTLLFGPPPAIAPSSERSSPSTGPDPSVLARRRRRAALPVALASLVGLIVVTGTSVPASLAGSSQPPFTVVLPAQVAQQVAQTPPPVEEAPAPVVDDSVEPLVEAPLEETPVEQTPVAEEEVPADETPAEETPPAEAPAETSPIKHVFLVTLGATDVNALAGDETAAPYLAGTLAKSGTLLSDYRTIARGGLANRIALISGQGPTPQTLDDCTTFGDVRPADPLADGQTGGDGCVYGFETGHLGDQLRALERTWKAYVEPAAGASAAGTPTARVAAACQTDAATTRRNPFLWFRGTFEADDCGERNAPLTQLTRDLRDAETTPALAWIASDAQQGSADADRFLEQIVPQIQNSLAYADGGLIVIVGEQPPAAEVPAPPAATTPTTPVPPPAATTPAAPPAPTPTTPVEPPATTPTPPVEPPPTTPTTPTTPQDPPPPTTPTDPPADTTPRAAPPLARVAGTATAPRALGPLRYPNVGDAAAAGAGTPVGALLISSYTPAGRIDATPANAFTLLRTLQRIYGVDPLGYAAAEGITPLSDDLFSVTP